jgi:hemolysin activation/secretion protein
MQVAQTAALVLWFIMHFYFPACRQLGQCALWCLFSATFLTVSAWAQPVKANPDEVSEQQRRIQEERNQDLRKRLEPSVDVRTGPDTTVSSTKISDGESPCFLLHTIELALPAAPGTPKASAQEAFHRFGWVLREIENATPMGPPDSAIGRCIGLEGVSLLSKRAQDALLQAGFVTTRALIEPQNLSSGTLTITIVPGVVHQLVLSPDTQAKPRMLHSALPMRPGDVLNLRDIEQALENFKRLPTVEADIQITPSQEAVDELGQSDLVLSIVQQKQLRLSASLDDGGSKGTGKYQGNATVSLDNLLNLNDTMYLTLGHDLGGANGAPPSLDSDADRNGTRANTVHYSMPWGYWTLGATASRSRYFQTVAGLTTDYRYSGTSANNEISLGRIVHRDATGKTSLTLKAWQRDSQNFIDDTEVQVQRRLVSGWELGLNHKDIIGGVTVGATVNFKKANGDFGNLAAPEEAFGEGSSLFELFNWELNLSSPLKLPFLPEGQRMRWNALARGQNPSVALTPQDRFSIGGRYSVRGYDGEMALSGERGWLVRNELSWGFDGSSHEVYLGIDQGEVSGPSTQNLVGRYLSGAVIGLRASWGRLQYELFVGAPITRPERFNTAATTTGFSLNYSY